MRKPSKPCRASNGDGLGQGPTLCRHRGPGHVRDAAVGIQLGKLAQLGQHFVGGLQADQAVRVASVRRSAAPAG